MDTQLSLPVASSGAGPIEVLRAENCLLELAARNAPLPAILDVLATSAERLVGDGARCSILLLDKSGRHLLHGAAPNLPDAYSEEIDGLEVGPAIGSCVTAEAGATEIVVQDIGTHPCRAACKDLAERHGLRACWSTPILSSKGDVLGTLTVYYVTPREPDTAARVVVQMLARTAALVIERLRLHEQLTKTVEEHTETQDLLRTAQQAAHLAAWRWNIADGSMFFAPGGAEIFDVPLSHICSRSLYMQQVVEEDREDVQRIAAEAIERCQDYESEFRARVRGQMRWLRCQSRPVVENGTCTHVVGVTSDITSRKRGEDALRASEKLAATGRLAATIAHEINNPLEAVTNFIFLAKSNKEVPVSVRRQLDIADQELARVTHIAQQTLGFYRDTTAPVRMDLATVLDDVLLVYERKMIYKSVRLKKEYEPGLWLTGLRGELRQVFSNLLANAIDASNEDHDVTVRARYVQRLNNGARELRVTVADTGRGIEKEHRARVFEPFFTTKQEVGTGLGLWVTKGIVAKHNGRIGFRSSVGQRHGSVFSIALPIPNEKIPD